MQQKRCTCCRMGTLPSKAPLANPYVPYQTNDPVKYEPARALVRGTLYQDLDLPFMGMSNTQLKPATPMTNLQAIGFAVQELALYLDTHKDDVIALEQYHHMQLEYQKAKVQYERQYGPLTHCSPSEGSYQWLNDPWPWEYARNKRC